MNDMPRETGYVDYVALLGLPPDFKPGDVRRVYRKKMKDLMVEISRAEITEERKNHYLLQIAQLNAAFYILRDRERGEKYLADRKEVVDLEEEWRT
ncbi:MAG TPA: hypothetical protein PKX28_05825, partial [Candidatus Hydrogenedentes bacterium]|nr:hypothetical protein [Candidatus Hydrogenedentota bacterium]